MVVYPTVWSCLKQLAFLKITLINFGKTNILSDIIILYSILKLKFKEPEAEVGIKILVFVLIDVIYDI